MNVSGDQMKVVDGLIEWAEKIYVCTSSSDSDEERIFLLFRVRSLTESTTTLRTLKSR